MLEHIAIIDDCDILGQKLDAGNGIQKVCCPLRLDLHVGSSFLIKLSGARSSVQRPLELLRCCTRHIDQQGLRARPNF